MELDTLTIYQDYRQHLEWPLHILISMDTAYCVL